MKRSYCFVLSFFVLTMLFTISGTAMAQDSGNSDRIVVLQVPYVLNGDYTPLTSRQIHKALEKNVEKAYPRVDLVVVKDNDPLLGDIDITAPLTMSDVRKLAKAFSAQYVSWGTLQFTSNARSVTGGPDSAVIQTLLTIEAVAEARIYDAQKQEIVVDQRMVQANNERTRAIEISNAYHEVEIKLVNECVDDLSTNLTKALKRELEKAESQK